MKQLALVLVIMLVLVSQAFAGRIDDLTAENAQIDNLIAQRKQEISQLTQRKIANLGGIRELQLVEAEKVEAEKVEEEAGNKGNIK